MAFPGIGTIVNVMAVLVGSSVGLLLGARLPTRTRDTVTDALGLVTLLIGALSAAEVGSAALAGAVGSAAPVLIVLGALLLGGIAGSLLDIEARLEGFGGWLRTRLARRRGAARRHVPIQAQARETQSGEVPAGTVSTDSAPSESAARERFIEGFVTASLSSASALLPSSALYRTVLAAEPISSSSRRRWMALPQSPSQLRLASASWPRWWPSSWSRGP